jgi:hypothetical protein
MLPQRERNIDLLGTLLDGLFSGTLPTVNKPILKVQEVSHDDPDSCNHFRPSTEKPFVATPGAIEMYSQEIIIECLTVLQSEAKKHDGLDYLQTFDDPDKPEGLWFIEDGEGGAITALLPSEY